MTRLSQFIHKLIASPGLARLSRPEFKRVRITAYLSIVCIFIALAYCTTDLSNGVYYSSPAYGILFLNSVAVIILLRRSFFVVAKVLLVVTINLVVFYASIGDPFEAGTYLLFIPAGVSSFAVLGLQDQVKGYYLTTFTSLLFLFLFLATWNLAMRGRRRLIFN
jgi:hypothetical protein